MIGRKKSGKTTTTEFIVNQLVREGFKIGCLKHIHHQNFTFDTKGKDTWRFAQAGAEIVVGAATDEVAIIVKTKTLQEDLDQLLNLFGERKLDFIILEGFHTLVADRKDVFKIIAARDQEGLRTVLAGTSPPILAVTGSVASEGENSSMEIPVIDIQTHGDKLIDLVRKLSSKE